MRTVMDRRRALRHAEQVLADQSPVNLSLRNRFGINPQFTDELIENSDVVFDWSADKRIPHPSIKHVKTPHRCAMTDEYKQRAFVLTAMSGCTSAATSLIKPLIEIMA